MDETEKSTPAPGRAREPHIDVMKGIGMLLVLVFHMQTESYLGYSILGYSAMFMMPLFFFVSGYLYPSSSDAGLSFGRFALKKVKTLLVPYAVFFVLSFLWTETVYAAATGAPLFSFTYDWMKVLLAFLLAGEYLYELPVVPFPLWFLHAMFFACLVFFFIVKIRRKLFVALVAFALALASIPLQAALKGSPLWFVRLLPLALFYMLCGYLFRHFVVATTPAEPHKPLPLGIPAGGFVALVCLLLGLYCMRLGGGEMWSIASYWHFPGALVCILGCYLFSRCTNNRILQFVGRYSILYLGLHPMMLQLPFIESLPAWFSAKGFDGIMVYVGYFVASFLLVSALVVAAAFLQRGFRRLVRRTKADSAG